MNGEPTRPYDRVAVVVNGNAKRVTADLVEILDQIVQSGDLFVSRSLEEGREIAKTIVARGYPTVLTGGGDGTFVQMVTWIAKEADRIGARWPRFGFLKLGTGNALAWVLGSENLRDKGVVADLARLRKEGGSRKLRLLEVEGTLTPFAGLGIDAICLDHYNQTKEWMSKVPGIRRFSAGGVAYGVSAITRSLPEFIFRAHPKVRVINEGEDAILMDPSGRPSPSTKKKGEVLYEGPTRMVSMGTVPYWGFGARIFPYADEREDRFSLRIVDITSAEVVTHFPSIFRGTYRSPAVLDYLCERISVHFEEPMPLQIGGDAAGVRTTVHAALAPKPLEVVDYYAPPPL